MPIGTDTINTTVSILLLWNLLVFFLYGMDKLCAKKHWSRISEAVLLGISFCMGAIGAAFGMIVWNHKTSKMKFRLLVPLMAFVNLVLSGWLCAVL